MTWVKLCAMTNVDDALAAVRAGADAVGFVFAPSKRRVDAETVAAITRALPPGIEKVGVFADESADVIRDVVARAGLTTVQLQGDEDEQFVRDLSSRTNGAKFRIIKTVHVDANFETRFRAFANTPVVHAILLDSGTAAERGGTGRTFSWESIATVLSRIPEKPLVIVAGGLNPDNVANAIAVLQPWGVDVASGVERQPGSKDPEKMNAFVAAVREAEKRS